MENFPLVSVLMPVYNSEKYVKDAIKSILNQTYTNFEIIVVDDGSTDNSRNIIESFQDKRIKLYINEKNEGIAFSRNKCLSFARGKYIAKLDSDDIAVKHRLEKQIDFLEKNKKIGILASSADLIDGEGVLLKNSWVYNIPSRQIPIQLFINNCFIQSTIMFRKECLPKDGAYRLEYPPCEDYDLWIRMLKKCNAYISSEILVQYRIHQTNSTKIQIEKKNNAERLLKQSMLREIGLNADEIDMAIYESIFHNLGAFDMLVIENWLVKLMQGNRQNFIYDILLFERTLLVYYLKYLRMNTKSNLISYIMNQSILFKFLNLKEKIRLFLKVIFK